MTENIKTLLEIKQYFTARIYAGTLPPEQQKIELEDILAHCIKKGLVRECRETAELLGRSLKPKELNALWAEQNAYDGVTDAILAASMFSKQQREIKLKKILKICLLSDWLELAEETCLFLGRKLTLPELKLMLVSDAKNGWQNAEKIVSQMPELHRSIAIEKIIKDNVDKCELGEAQKYAKLAGRKLTNNELTIIMDELIERKDTPTAVVAAGMMQEPLRSEQLSMMLEFFISERQIDRALDTAERLGINIEPDKLKQLREWCIAIGWRIKEAKKLAKQMGMPLTTDELKSMLAELSARINWGSSIDVIYIEKIAICLDEQDRKEQLALFMNLFLDKRDFNKVQAIAKMLDGQRVTIGKDYV
ncbi:MAG: hypothetical protein WCO55_05625 [Candidatus Falkowbacteria bacterium]